MICNLFEIDIDNNVDSGIGDNDDVDDDDDVEDGNDKDGNDDVDKGEKKESKLFYVRQPK